MTVLAQPRPPTPVRPASPRRQRIPLFLRAQAECLTCGREIRDPLTIEEWGRYCSARCHFGAGLPPLLRQGA